LESISKNITKINEFKDAVYYTAICACGDDTHHNITIELEKEKDTNMLYMNFYKNIAWSSHWGEMNWFKRIYKRIKCSLKILFTGYVELEECFIIQGEDQINDFIKALEEGKHHIIKNSER
jgi:hypothetical protein